MLSYICSTKTNVDKFIVMIRNKMMLVAIAFFLSTASFAQDTKGEKGDKGAKGDKKELQTIVITREGDGREKLNITIDGDDIRINGKKVDEEKGSHVSISRIKDRDAWAGDWQDELRRAEAEGRRAEAEGRRAEAESRRAMAEHQRALAQQRRALADLHIEGQGFHFDADEQNFNFFSSDSNRAMLGVITDEDEKGARITSVTSESAAAKAGLKEGDIITRIDDKKIADADDVAEAVRAHKPGEKIAITVLRDGKEQKFTAELGKWKGFSMNGSFAPNVRITTPRTPAAPLAPLEGFEVFGTVNRPKLGLTVQDRDDRQGVDVLEVEKDGIADKAGIRKGDVIVKMNGREVRSADGLRLYSTYNNVGTRNGDVKMEIKRDGKSQVIEIKFPRELKKVDL